MQKRGGFLKNKCPKCGGNMYVDVDSEFGWVEQCLQCAFTSVLGKIVDVHEAEKSGKNNRQDKNLAGIKK
jgi:hypothetical protein